MDSVEQVYTQAFAGTKIDFGLPMSPQIYSIIRLAIVQGRIPPKTPIYEAKFGEIIGVSRTPLRAALQQLAKEGLVETRPQVGSIVAPIDQRKILSSVFCRGALEIAVVRRLAGMRDIDLGRVNQILAVQAECTARDDYNSFFPADESFHALLAQLAGVPEAWQLVLSSKTHVDRARMQLQASIPGRAEIAYRQHLSIVEALKAHDEDRAAALMDEHVHSALDILKVIR